jgi:hypothetical protein
VRKLPKKRSHGALPPRELFSGNVKSQPPGKTLPFTCNLVFWCSWLALHVRKMVFGVFPGSFIGVHRSLAQAGASGKDLVAPAAKLDSKW